MQPGSAIAQAYIPDGLALLIVVVLCNCNILLGYWLQHCPRRGCLLTAWVLALGSTALAEFLFRSQPAGFRMVGIVLVLLYGMKAVVGTASSLKEKRSLPFSRWMMFAVLWPGMRPTLFLRSLRQSPHVREFATWGLIHMGIGAGFAVLARWVWPLAQGQLYSPAGWAAWLCMMIAASVILHFGIFNLMAALWQWRGIDATPLFRAPMKSRTLAEFWSRRWNLAFSEMTALVIFQPVSKRLGRAAGTMAAFMFSGLLHEMAISWPVGRGYGLPTLYFIIQGIVVLVTEHYRLTGWPARLIAIITVVAPFPVMFHYWFLQAVIVPLLN